ncbi:hypothetical protein BH18ACI4_BH18ACI4_23260 [soil metagenome]
MQHETLDNTTLGIEQSVYDNEHGFIQVSGHLLNSANLQPGDHTKKDVLLSITVTPSAFIHSDATTKVPDNLLSDIFAFVGNDNKVVSGQWQLKNEHFVTCTLPFHGGAYWSFGYNSSHAGVS